MPSTVTVKVTEHKLPKRVVMRVGILAPDMYHPAEPGKENEGPITIKALAEIHEFGLGVTERSFIRAAYDEMHAEIEAIALKQMQLAGPEIGAERTAMKAAAMFQNRMVAGLQPDIADETKKDKERRGLSPPFKPLIETGILKSSIVGDVEVVE